MQSDPNQSAFRATQQAAYNMDRAINAISSLDDEQSELEREEANMVISSFDVLYSDSSIFNDFPLPLGVMVQPFSMDSSRICQVDTEPIRCNHCGAIVSSASEVGDDGYWKCAFCETMSSFSYGSGEAVAGKKNEVLSAHPELLREGETREYCGGTTDANVLYSPAADTKALIFIIDKSLTTAQFKHIQESLSVVLGNLSLSHYYVGLIVYSDIIEIYELGGTVGEADVFPGNRMPSQMVRVVARVDRRTSSTSGTTRERAAIAMLTMTRRT